MYYPLTHAIVRRERHVAPVCRPDYQLTTKAYNCTQPSAVGLSPRLLTGK